VVAVIFGHNFRCTVWMYSFSVMLSEMSCLDFEGGMWEWRGNGMIICLWMLFVKLKRIFSSLCLMPQWRIVPEMNLIFFICSSAFAEFSNFNNRMTFVCHLNAGKDETITGAFANFILNDITWHRGWWGQQQANTCVQLIPGSEPLLRRGERLLLMSRELLLLCLIESWWQPGDRHWNVFLVECRFFEHKPTGHTPKECIGESCQKGNVEWCPISQVNYRTVWLDVFADVYIIGKILGMCVVLEIGYSESPSGRSCDPEQREEPCDPQVNDW